MRRVRPALLPFLGLLLLELAAWALALISGLSTVDELRLRREGVETVASVTALRRDALGRHDIRYAFDAPGTGTVTHRDRSGREDLWVWIAPEATEEAKAGRVRVIYLPDAPQVSRPVAPGGSPLGDPLAALLVLALPLNLLAALLWRRVRHSFSAAREAAKRGEGDEGPWSVFWRLR